MTCCAACAADITRLTEEQSDNLAALIGRAYPGWTIWRWHGVWYATGQCPQTLCGCRRSLAAPSPGCLVRELRLHMVPGPRLAQSRGGSVTDGNGRPRDRERCHRVPDANGVGWWPDGTELGPIGQAAMQRICARVQRICGSKAPRREAAQEERGATS